MEDDFSSCMAAGSATVMKIDTAIHGSVPDPWRHRQHHSLLDQDQSTVRHRCSLLSVPEAIHKLLLPLIWMTASWKANADWQYLWPTDLSWLDPTQNLQFIRALLHLDLELVQILMTDGKRYSWHLIAPLRRTSHSTSGWVSWTSDFNVSLESWGTHLNGQVTLGLWSSEESDHIHVLELRPWSVQYTNRSTSWLMPIWW